MKWNIAAKEQGNNFGLAKMDLKTQFLPFIRTQVRFFHPVASLQKPDDVRVISKWVGWATLKVKTEISWNP